MNQFLNAIISENSYEKEVFEWKRNVDHFRDVYRFVSL